MNSTAEIQETTNGIDGENADTGLASTSINPYRVDCADAVEWEEGVENHLFPGYLKPLGMDPACKNESRLSRMPGHRRADTGQVQRVLYLAPMGKAVCE